METVTFDNEPRQSRTHFAPRGFSGFLIRTGLVHTESQATSLLVLTSILCFLIAGYIMMHSNEDERFNPGRHFVPVYEY